MSSITSNTSSHLIVGTPELGETKSYPEVNKTYSKYECDESTLPKTFKIQSSRYFKMLKLQEKMMDNGWKLCEGEESETDYFIHPTYPSTKFTAYSRVIEGTTFIIPIVDMCKDVKGLGCSFIISPGMKHSTLRCNEWTSYWTTRVGKKRAKYRDYLDTREQKKEQIQEEEKEAKKHLKQKLSSNL